MRPNNRTLLYATSAICHEVIFMRRQRYETPSLELSYVLLHKNITNTEHTQDAHLLLRRLVIYAHTSCKHGTESICRQRATHTYSRRLTFKGTLDLFMLCVIMRAW